MDNPATPTGLLFAGPEPDGETLRAHLDRPVTVATTIEDARRLTDDPEVAGIITEYRLRDGTGLDLLEAVRETDPDLPVVLWTAVGSESIASRAIAGGVTDYVVRDGDDARAVERLEDRLAAIDLADPTPSQTISEAVAKDTHIDRLLETNPTGMVIVGPDGDIVGVNDRMETILGMSKADITVQDLSDHDFEITDWDDNPVPVDELPSNRVQATGEPVYQVELGVKRENGPTKWLLIDASPLPMAGGTGVINTVSDVTELKRRKDQLAESERKFRAVFEEAFDGMLLANEDTEYVDVNPAACDLFGLSKGELLGRSIDEFAPPDYDFESAWQEFRAADRDRGMFPLVRPDGEERIVEFAATSNVLPGRHLSVLRDVTERTEMYEQLQSERDRTQQYLDAARVMMVALDESGEVTRVNKRTCEILGMDKPDIVGRDWFETFVAEDERAAVRQGFDRLLAEEIDPKDLDFENTIVTADGNERHIKWQNTRLLRDSGRTVGMLSSGTDITEQRQYEETLTALYDSVQELIGIETKADVSEVVVETITGVMDIPGVAMYLYDADEELLKPDAQSLETDFMREELPPVPPDDSSLTGHVFTTGESERFDDIHDSPYLQTDETDMRAGMFVPIAEHGILIIGSRAVGAFDHRTQQLVELVAANAEAGYDHVERRIELRQNRERLSLALDAANAGIWDWTVETDEIVWYDSLDDLYSAGSATVERSYERLSTATHPDDWPAVDATLQDALETDTRFRQEFRTVQDDGSVRWIDARGTVRTDDGGTAVGMVGVGIDITERKERERDLELLRDIVDATSDGMNVIDLETAEFVETNEASCRMLGYDRDELLSMTVHDINPEFSMDMWADFVGTVQEAGETVLESHHRRKDGSTFPVEIRIRRVNLDKDYHVATVRDITDRKRREDELKESEQKFRSLIETAPDPIFVIDTDSWEVTETNSAACSIRNQSREELIGLHYTELHPTEDDDRYESLFEDYLDEGTSLSQFPDGDPILLSTAEDDRIPVSISARTVDLGDRTHIHGIFRDVSDQKQHEASLEELSQAAQTFLEAETDHEIAQTTVNVATDALALPATSVYFYDDENGLLTPVAYSDSADEIVGHLPTFGPGEGIAWRVFTDQEPAVFDDVRTDEGVYNPETPIRSELIIPLGNHGVFMAGHPEPEIFDQLTVDLAEVLTATAETALDRLAWTRQLHEREREAERSTAQLERLNQINEKIRSIIRAVVQADTRDAVQSTTCEHLAELDRFDFAWIGEPDHAANVLEPVARAGRDDGYLQGFPLALNGQESNPAVRTARTREATHIPNVASAVQAEPWRKEALLSEYRSVLSVPLLHDGILYGVLTIFAADPGTFDDLSVSVLSDLGELIGYGLNAVEQRNALLASDVVELTFEFADLADVFGDLAARLDRELEIRSLSSRPDGAYLAYVTGEDLDPERFAEVAAAFGSIDEVRTVSDGDPVLVELVVTDPTLVTSIIDLAATPHAITLGSTGSRLTVSIPRQRNVRAFIERFGDRFPEATLVARQEETRSGSPARLTALLEALTERQREVLRSAYFGGFFEQPRTSTGSEIADSLGISQPAFSKQLRTSQRNLLTPLFDPS